MTTSPANYWKHFSKALFWLAGTLIFGLAPILFLKVISILSEEFISAKEMEQMIEVGFILFVACAAAGSVVFDFIAMRFKTKGMLQFFAVYLFPFCILAYLFYKYLMLYVQFSDQHEFGPGLFAIWITVGFSLLYSLFAKAYFFSRKERMN